MNFDFGEVVSRAWQITWKHKMLWIYGFLQAIAGFLLLLLAIIPAFAPLISGQAGGITNDPWFFLMFFGGFFLFMLALYPLSVVMNGALTVGVLRAEQDEEKISYMHLTRSPTLQSLLQEAAS